MLKLNPPAFAVFSCISLSASACASHAARQRPVESVSVEPAPLAPSAVDPVQPEPPTPENDARSEAARAAEAREARLGETQSQTTDHDPTR
jgi:hypothetical protein